METVYIGSEREVFWDDYIVDTEKTTAKTRVHSPVRKELVMSFNEPWEGAHCYFINMFRDTDRFRMYYHASNGGSPSGVRICYAESADGIRWVKPKLGICEFAGSRENNIVLSEKEIPDVEHPQTDNMFVFKDKNPACPADERYKGVSNCCANGTSALKCFVSADGLHFRYGWDLYERKSFFDSLNTAFYDPRRNRYFCYFRGWHPSGELIGAETSPDIEGRTLTRDIRVMESEDFHHWSEPKQLDYGKNARDFHLYTNNIEPYYRAPQIYVGFPARYTDRSRWTDNYEKLCGREERLERVRGGVPRFGYAVTDCLFMCSRDGERFYRPDEAFLRPGPENDWSWRYGDCFMNAGMFEVPSPFPNEAPELSFLSPTKRWTHEKSGNLLHRYGIRVDGFISRYAGFDTAVLETKPFIFSGNKLAINFETAAAGSVYVELTDQNGKTMESFRSAELFGNAIDREVGFEGDLGAMQGKTVRLRFRMSDADLYSFRFIR